MFTLNVCMSDYKTETVRNLCKLAPHSRQIRKERVWINVLSTLYECRSIYIIFFSGNQQLFNEISKRKKLDCFQLPHRQKKRSICEVFQIGCFSHKSITSHNFVWIPFVINYVNLIFINLLHVQIVLFEKYASCYSQTFKILIYKIYVYFF